LIAVHVKARYWAKVVSELKGLKIPELEIGELGKVYTF
jgi:hypothetical protein